MYHFCPYPGTPPISQEFKSQYGEEKGRRLTADEVTAFLHSRDIRALKKELTSYLKHKNEIWLLFDNLDKGWAKDGITGGDITILRCLIDAARKVQRDLVHEGIDFRAVVFVRNDIYQLLMDESPDFGKETRATLDWSDPELLRSVLAKRLLQNSPSSEATFDSIWPAICVSHYMGEETSQMMIDRSLMRPRYLLKLFNACKGFAVNLQHDRINNHDIERGLQAFSIDLLVDADLELTQIESTASRLIYKFLDEGERFLYADLAALLEMHGLPQEKTANVIEFMLYYGFLGITQGDADVKYIYDVGYNMELLKTRISKNKEALTFAIHPAFGPALGFADKKAH